MKKEERFVKAQKTKYKRLIISVEGEERSGKTSFGLSAPPPIVLIPIDPGLEGVVDKWIGKKEILVPNISFNYKDSTNIKEWEEMWESLKEYWIEALSRKDIRSLVVDTSTEVWELARLARLGKLSQVQPYHYGPVNAEFRDLLKKVYDTDKNLVLIHKMKSEYVNDKSTGELIRAGFNDTGYTVQINLLCAFNMMDKQFSLHVRDCRQNMDVADETLLAPMNTFPVLAQLVYPETDEGDWE